MDPGGRRSFVLVTLCCLAAACGDGNNNDDEGSPGTPTPAATATAPPQIPCPEQVTYIVTSANSDFDAGFSGIYYDQTLGDGGSLTFAVDCPGSFLGACGVCPISGPIASTTVVDNQRCQNATEIACTSDADCPGDACVFFFGAPVPVSGGGVPICVTNRVLGEVTGTISPEMGSGSTDFDIVLSIYTGLTEDRPCPTCSGSAVGASGTCLGGERDGESCTVGGTTPVFGNTSFDCPPNPSANIGNTTVPLDLTTGTSSLQPSATCTAGSLSGLPCYCADQPQPNSCTDGVCTISTDDEGTCEAGPVDRICAIERFRSCVSNGDCPAAGDTCIDRRRKCLGPADATGTTGPLERTGTASPAHPVQVSTFCIESTSSTSVNAVAGLPGPGAVRLPTDVCIKSTCP